MHQSALKYGKAFFDTYLARIEPEQLSVIDVGSQDVNGALRQFAPPGSSYVGVDFAVGAGVDVVLSDPYRLPFDTGTVDAVVCSSVFEHSEFFWLLFLECLRIVKSDGLVYLNVPSNGMVHRYPVDGWRFYPDAGSALANWARRHGEAALLLESFIAPKCGPVDGEGMWNDFVAVFLKDERNASLHPRRIVDSEPGAFCAYAVGRDIPWVPSALNPDNAQLTHQSAEIETLSEEVAKRGARLDAARAEIAALSRDLAECKRRADAAYAEVAALSHDLRDRSACLDAACAEIVALRSSTSWRLTAPVRWLAGAVKAGGSDRLAPVAGSVALPPSAAAAAIEHATTPAFQVLSGLGACEPPRDTDTDGAKLIAFYLPQYHRIPENSEWWGPGFTEWTNVVKGRPNYAGHYQPHLPRELGFYDLSNVEVMREQAEMARLYGVGAFCFYYYWFSGRRILDKPIENFLRSDIDFEYCLCWANENWTRTWDGDTRSVLMEQKYLETDPQAFIASLLPHFGDPRYIRVDGKPMVVVYRAKEIPDPPATFAIWRQAAEAAGFPGLHIAVVDFYDIARPDEVGADALIEFPPHKFNGPQSVPDTMPSFTNRDFRGGIVDYAKVMAQSANRPTPDFTLYRGVLPSWDNTARRQDTPTILHGSSPELFECWLRYVRAYTREAFRDRRDPFIFINAWNEWGEGCHLEPDQKWGLRYLESLKASAWFDPASSTPDSARRNLLAAAATSIAQRNRPDSSSSPPALEETLAMLVETRAADSTVHKIAVVLRDYPLAHWAGKTAYRFYLSMRRRYQ